jgi:hypothetical protein
VMRPPEGGPKGEPRRTPRRRRGSEGEAWGWGLLGLSRPPIQQGRLWRSPSARDSFTIMDTIGSFDSANMRAMQRSGPSQSTPPQWEKATLSTCGRHGASPGR